MASNLLRPTSALADADSIYGATKDSANTIGAFSSDSAADRFAIKVFSFNAKYSVPVVETTGSGDSAPTYEHGGHVYGQFQMTGAMLSDSAIGLAHLATQVQSGVSVQKITLEYANAHANNISGKKVIIDSIGLQHTIRQNAIVGVTISGRFTEDAITG